MSDVWSEPKPATEEIQGIANEGSDQMLFDLEYFI